jgi:hypothetical protein
MKCFVGTVWFIADPSLPPTKDIIGRSVKENTNGKIINERRFISPPQGEQQLDRRNQPVGPSGDSSPEAEKPEPIAL